jgi:excisionase family DNA binding protein
MPVTTPPKVYTVEEVAEILRVNPMTVYRMARDGRIKAFKVGTTWRITQEALDAFMRGAGEA